MKPELLSPAGSPESLRAAVQNGAGAVYLGWGEFNARRSAKNFSDEEFVTQFREASGSEELADAFIERGGVPNFAQQMTIFAQTYEGIEVVEEICAAAVQEATNAAGYTPPAEECKIISIEITEYSAE